jgi:uncharacterized protein YlxW (UPF0749 family)
MNPDTREKLKNIVPFDTSPRDKETDELDRSGHAILALLQQAAQAARANEERANGIAQKLSNQLQAAEDRAAQLEAEVKHYQQRAFSAEKWLLRVYKEIEDKFFNRNTEAKTARQ